MQSRAIGFQSSNRSVSLKRESLEKKVKKLSNHNSTRSAQDNQSNKRLILHVSSDGAADYFR
jgi:hypothetical protein